VFLRRWTAAHRQPDIIGLHPDHHVFESRTRLGHYNVTALIGEGGMGQVWQATDTQLNRQVCGEGRRAVGSRPAVRFYVRVIVVCACPLSSDSRAR